MTRLDYRCSAIKSVDGGYILACLKEGDLLEPLINVFLSDGMILTMARETITGEIPWDWKTRDYSAVEELRKDTGWKCTQCGTQNFNDDLPCRRCGVRVT